MLTLTGINRALDRLGVEVFIPRTRRPLAVRVDAGTVDVGRDPERAVLPIPPRLAVIVPLRGRRSSDGARPAEMHDHAGRDGLPSYTIAAPVVRSVNGNPLAEVGREAPLARGRVVTFRIATPVARRPQPFVPGVLIRLDERRISTGPRRRSSRIEWFVVGSAATVLLLFVVRLLLR